MVNFLIIVTGYNCKEYVESCLDSIYIQRKHRNKYITRIVVVNDGSDDATLLKIKIWFNRNIAGHDWRIFDHTENNGAAFCRYNAIKRAGLDDKEVIILIGLDDELLPGALEEISEQYEAGKWMTYGNWSNQHGESLPASFDLDFDEQTHANRDYRKVKYRSTAPNTFYKALFDKIPMQDFMLNGKWLDTTTESEIMFSCLEMSGKDRIGIIRKPIYKYNQNLPNGTQRRLGQDYKNAVLAEIMKRPKRDLLINL